MDDTTTCRRRTGYRTGPCGNTQRSATHSATVQVSPSGDYVFVANFNLHGEMVPSSVSVVYAPEMIEIARVETCVMPHGSRFNPQGTKHYSACMMNDALVEISLDSFKVSRHFVLTKGSE